MLNEMLQKRYRARHCNYPRQDYLTNGGEKL